MGIFPVPLWFQLFMSLLSWIPWSLSISSLRLLRRGKVPGDQGGSENLRNEFSGLLLARAPLKPHSWSGEQPDLDHFPAWPLHRVCFAPVHLTAHNQEAGHCLVIYPKSWVLSFKAKSTVILHNISQRSFNSLFFCLYLSSHMSAKCTAVGVHSLLLGPQLARAGSSFLCALTNNISSFCLQSKAGKGTSEMVLEVETKDC